MHIVQVYHYIYCTVHKCFTKKQFIMNEDDTYTINNTEVPMNSKGTKEDPTV